MIDSRVPQVTISPESTNSNPLAGYPSALFNDPVYTFDSTLVLFGAQTTSVKDIKLTTGSNAPNVTIRTRR